MARYGGVDVLVGGDRGAYPYGNSLLVRGRGTRGTSGSSSTLVIDPSLALADTAPPADTVLVSHGHEDHIAGLGNYDVPVHAHTKDVDAVRSREALVAGSGLPPEEARAADDMMREEFHIEGHPDVTGFEDGTVFDLGGRTVTAVHLPGHTPGHSGFLIEPDGFFFVADIDLTSFGPYYGDVGSNLPDFEASMARCREIDARWYGTGHQKGVIEGADEFRRRLAAYADVVQQREDKLLAFLSEPRTLDRIAAHRLVYRPHVEGVLVRTVELRTAERHLNRLLGEGRAEEVEPGLFRAV
ncbi:MBL fold metallo-hydrolase [Nocardiopsis sp. HNM0947]|uniref:MBL fold metallo-hydrolase n=1 Tax=Nocardiopsis coralli TaxID=2772213 RepID=A0ABR9PDP6_9ACTN|nr:MBL fold metallo-hydrolase [Nocardiopsis coralli]